MASSNKKEKKSEHEVESREEKKVKKVEKNFSIEDYCSAKGFPKFAQIAAKKLYKGQKKTLENWNKLLKNFNFKKK